EDGRPAVSRPVREGDHGADPRPGRRRRRHDRLAPAAALRRDPSLRIAARRRAPHVHRRGARAVLADARSDLGSRPVADVAGVKLLYMLAATLPQDGVALVLLFSREPFYEFYVHVPSLIDSLTPLIDQTLAGAVLMVLGKATMSVAALSVFFRWFGGEHADDRTRVRWGVR